MCIWTRYSITQRLSQVFSQITNGGINTATHCRLLTGVAESSLLVPAGPSTELQGRPLSLRKLFSFVCSASSLARIICLLGNQANHRYQKTYQRKLTRAPERPDCLLRTADDPAPEQREKAPHPRVPTAGALLPPFHFTLNPKGARTGPSYIRNRRQKCPSSPRGELTPTHPSSSTILPNSSSGDQITHPH
jgi:hypothetical protein